jgi:hypothetical protein
VPLGEKPKKKKKKGEGDGFRDGQSGVKSSKCVDLGSHPLVELGIYQIMSFVKKLLEMRPEDRQAKINKLLVGCAGRQKF